MEGNNNFAIVAIALAVVMVIAAVMGGIAYSVHQGTVRRQTCVESGGSWVNNNQCLRFVELTEER